VLELIVVEVMCL